MQTPLFNQYPGCESIHNQSKNPVRYTLSTYILFFFTFSFIGWIWEVVLHFFVDGSFVNRGVLFGPWLPIYGSGGILMILLLRHFHKKPVLTFCLSTLLCSVVEYGTSLVLEFTKGIRWWDYSGYLCNVSGRICLEGAIMFGLGGCIFIYILAPMIAEFYQKIPMRVQVSICVICLLVFSLDVGNSVIRPNLGEGLQAYQNISQLKEQISMPKWPRDIKLK